MTTTDDKLEALRALDLDDTISDDDRAVIAEVFEVPPDAFADESDDYLRYLVAIYLRELTRLTRKLDTRARNWQARRTAPDRAKRHRRRRNKIARQTRKGNRNR